MSQVSSLEHIEVGSEIEALLLESKLIKRFKPQYNIASKDDKSPYYIHFTKEKYPKPVLNHDPNNPAAGPFLSGLIARRVLKMFRRIAPYCSSSRTIKRPCLYSHLGLCNPCPGSLNPDKKNYDKNISRLKRLLRGEFSHVQSALKKQMGLAAKTRNFEQAADIRDKIMALEHLLSTPVLPDEYLINPNLVADKRQESLESLVQVLGLKSIPSRIEMYDIANLSGTSATGAMTVAVDGEINSKYYRHFTIKTKSTPDDVGMMREVAERRLKRNDWPKPDLIVVDGGKSQLSIFNNQLSVNVPAIALAKRDEIIYTLQGEEIKLDKRNPGLQLLQRLRDEAHRFSRRLHHKHRDKNLI